MNKTTNFPDFSMGKLLIMIDEQINEEERQKLREMYSYAENPVEITRNQHNIITGKAVSCLRQVAQRGGAKNEVHRCLQYLVICMDAKKYKLDYKQAYHELLISYLLEKYGENQTKKD